MNKLRNLVLIILISSSSLIFGQTNKFEVGLEMGPSLKSLYGNDALANDVSIGFLGGLTFQYNFSKLVSIRTNISFERKGLTTKSIAIDVNGNVIGEIKFHSNFDYLSVPLLCRFTIGKEINFFANAGPYLSYLIKQQDKSNAIGEYPETKIDNTHNFKRLDFGLTYGLGMIFPIREKLLLSAEIRNNIGLSNISSLPLVNDGSIKTNSIIILIGIAYRIGNKNE
ncbi:MAG: PorT family protein [Bacteroidales bacterium]|nr:PorT family protein [Bacteroidales bacterium]